MIEKKFIGSGYTMKVYKGNECGGGVYDYFFITDKSRKTDALCAKVFEEFKKVGKGYLYSYGDTIEKSLRYALQPATIEKWTIVGGEHDGSMSYSISGDGFSCGGREEDTIICKL